MKALPAWVQFFASQWFERNALREFFGVPKFLKRLHHRANGQSIKTELLRILTRLGRRGKMAALSRNCKPKPLLVHVKIGHGLKAIATQSVGVSIMSAFPMRSDIERPRSALGSTTRFKI